MTDDAARKPDAQTAAAVILMMGAIDDLEGGAVVVSKFASDDDNDDGVWRMSFEIVNRGDDTARSAPLVERVEPTEPLTKCPLCSQMTLGANDGRCRHCQYPD